MGDDDPPRLPDSFFRLLGDDLCDSLVALAVVIGTDIEELMIFPVVPAHHLSLPMSGFADRREDLAFFLPASEGCQKPAPG